MHQPVVDEDAGTHVLSASVALILDEELDVDVVFAVGIEVKLVLGLAGVSENSGNEVVLDISGHVDVAGLSVGAVRNAHGAAESGFEVEEGVFRGERSVAVHHGAVRRVDDSGGDSTGALRRSCKIRCPDLISSPNSRIEGACLRSRIDLSSTTETLSR